MPIEYDEWGAYCTHCAADRLFRRTRSAPNHLLHAFLTVFTCLLWGIVWLVVASSPTLGPWRCTVCGNIYQP